MASTPNSITLSLCFLFYVLLLCMHSISARDMKEQDVPKQKLEVWSQDSLVFNEHGHGNNERDKEEMHKQKPNSWVQHSLYSKEDDPYNGYNAIYKKHGNGNNERDMKEQEEEGDPYNGYKAMYKSKNHKSVNQAYITSYGDSNKKRVNQPYITSYGHSNKKRVNQPYITAYGKRKDSKVSTHDSKDSYAATYGKDSKDSYAATYRKNPKDSYSVTYKETEKDSYAATYGKNPKDSYAATYGKDSKDSYAATYKKESGDSYAATYGKDSKDSYAATYRKESEDTYGATHKVDHTEAFKTGFFTLDDLYVGNNMTLRFPINDFPHFLSKKEAETIPFSMSQLPSLLQLFSVSEDSPQAQAMRDTLEQCEFEPLTGETKTCVSSLESMIDFVRTIIGSESHLDILTTTLPATSSVPLQNHTILEISQDFYAPKWVACHPLPYPYAVFYCHFIGTGSKIFKVQLGNENGEKIEALGICHLDTSEWNPDHVLFQSLGIKAGEAPVCHFFPEKHLMWVPLPSKAAM